MSWPTAIFGLGVLGAISFISVHDASLLLVLGLLFILWLAAT